MAELRPLGVSEVGVGEEPESRRLVKRLEGDLRAAAVPLEIYTSLGPDFWDDFAAIALRLLASAQG